MKRPTAGEKVTSDEMERLRLESDTEFHLVRHYRDLPPGYIQTLIGKHFFVFNPISGHYEKNEISERNLQEALRTKGSKFNTHDFAIGTPKKLSELIRSKAIEQAAHQKLEWFEAHHGLKTNFTFELPFIVGSNSVIRLSDLSQTQRNSVVQESRGELVGDKAQINIIKNHPALPTNEISVIIGWPEDQEYPFILTAHPGPYAPVFPNEQQSEVEHERSKEFWEEHVFVSDE